MNYRKLFQIIFIIAVVQFEKCSCIQRRDVANRQEIFYNNENVLSYLRHQPENRFDENEMMSLKTRTPRNALTIKQTPRPKQPTDNDKNNSTGNIGIPSRPRFSLSRNTNLPLDPQAYRCKDKLCQICQNKTAEFRRKIITEFKKSLTEPADLPNIYQVPINIQLTKTTWNSSVCAVMQTRVKTLRKKDLPIGIRGMRDIFPTKKLFAKEIGKSCAIVSSAGSLAGSKMGYFIDLHDIVMRFNHAPTEGYEEDVGIKTTIRVVNSQVVSKPEFNFINSPMFENISIAAWDPSKYNASLLKWFLEPDFDLFQNYRKYKEKFPEADFYLVDPRSIWKLWNVLRAFSKVPIRKNPPSSGFIGLALLLPICSYVDVVEYMPSTRLSGRCHYYDSEVNPACTFGAWHPLAAEKLMSFDMNIADNYSVFQNGVIRIRQPNQNLCN